MSRTVDATSAIVDAGYSSRTPAAAYGALTVDLLERGVSVVNGGSAALGLARVADGRIDGYVERHLYAWDALAGLLLVEEAGGRANMFLDGRRADGGQRDDRARRRRCTRRCPE